MHDTNAVHMLLELQWELVENVCQILDYFYWLPVKFSSQTIKVTKFPTIKLHFMLNVLLFSIFVTEHFALRQQV